MRANMSDIHGFHYHVSVEQLRVFRSRTPAERLRWLEEMRELTWRLAPPKTKERWERLRNPRPGAHLGQGH